MRRPTSDKTRRIGVSGESFGGKSSGKSKRRRDNTAKFTNPPQLILLNKPFNVLSQFSDRDTSQAGNSGQNTRKTLADYINQPDFYPAGRLDRDSEGLLLLTNNGPLQARISHPRYKLQKTYLAQVEGEIDSQALQQLQTGIELKDGPAQALDAAAVEQPDWLWPRHPPVRYRKNVADSWLTLTIDEGRNRQVRRMTAAVGYPTLRLIRVSAGPWQLKHLSPGEWMAGDPFALSR